MILASVSDLNNDIVNLLNANELSEEEEEQRKQVEEVWVKALAPKAFKRENNKLTIAATKTQERRKDTDDREQSHNDNSMISRRNSNKSHQEEKQKKGERMATGEDPLPFSLCR